MQRRKVLGCLAGLAAWPTLSHAMTKEKQSTPPQPAEKTASPFILEGKTINGIDWNLALQKGKFTLVTFWATDCTLCRKELPLLRSFYEDNAKKGFEMIAVSLDRERRDVENYAAILFQLIPATQRFPMIWRNDTGVRDGFGAIPRTPTHFMFDRTGNLFRQRIGPLVPEDWDDLWTALSS